jgi:hypothetical protein
MERLPLEPFSVEIDPSKAVDGHRDLIKAKIPQTFDGVDAKDLTLWRVNITISEDDDSTPILLDHVTSSDKKKLDPATRLSKVFPGELLEETIHIIVQRPPPGNADAFVCLISSA